MQCRDFVTSSMYVIRPKHQCQSFVHRSMSVIKSVPQSMFGIYVIEIKNYYCRVKKNGATYRSGINATHGPCDNEICQIKKPAKYRSRACKSSCGSRPCRSKSTVKHTAPETPKYVPDNKTRPPGDNACSRNSTHDSRDPEKCQIKQDVRHHLK